MSYKKISFIMFGVFLLSSLSCTIITPDKELREELENNYIKFIDALKTGEEKIIHEAMSSYSYACRKNDYANAKQSFEKEMREIGETYPAPSELDFIRIFKKGPTAALLYSKDSKASEVFGRPMLTFIFVKFVNENSVWKTDAVEIIDIDKYDFDGSVTVFEESFLSDESLIDGKIRETPILVKEAEVSGIFEVSSKGLTATILINNIDQGKVDEVTVLRLVHGGLKFGENKVEISWEDIAGKTDRSIDVRIKAEGKNAFFEVFRYVSKEKMKGKYMAKFDVPREIIHRTMTDN